MTQIDLKSKFPSMVPVKSPPSLFRLNGCGVGMYGNRDHDAETGTYVSTLCVSLLFVPCLCLRAYRVADAQRGWYFLGREPLSKLARSWNYLLLTAIIGLAALLQYHSYTSSPSYKASHQMSEARKLVAQGQLSQAASIYQHLAAAGADQAHNATVALNELLDKETRQAPLGECAGVFAAASRIANRDGAVPPAEVVQKGLSLAGERADADPQGGLALLDAIRPLTVDTRPIDACRLPLLRKRAAAEPGNLDVLCPLASLLEQQNQLDEAKTLLLPVKANLGQGEGARVLGTILARQGDYEGAYGLLWPYVKDRLDKLHAAEQAVDSVVQVLWDQQIKLLNDNKGTQDFYARYRTANKEGQQALVQEYVYGRIKDDPRYVRTQDALHSEAAVVPVAMDLGIVMLQRAQAQPLPDLRKTQLESAEQVFLAIRGIAGKTGEYCLSLGQVYYWLGKSVEGRELFDQFLAGKHRDSDSLLAIAVRLRELGAVPEARTMAEEAYTKAPNDAIRHRAAGFRAMCEKDTDDKIVWLRKADPADAMIKAKLAGALGSKAIAEGSQSEALAQYHVAIDAYQAMPQNATTLNETAGAWYAIFAIKGDAQALSRCFDYIQRAVDLSPSDPILLGNAADMLLEATVADIIGADIDLHALHMTGDFSLLGYLYHDKEGRDAVVRRVKEHPGMARALSYYEKLMVIAPKNTHGYVSAYEIHHRARNDAAMEILAQRVQGATFDTSDELVGAKDFINGVKDEQSKIGIASGMKRVEESVGKVRDKGGRTLAVALGNQIEMMFFQDMIQGDVDPQKVVALAEEVNAACPSARGSAVLSTAYLFRASKDLCHSDPAFASFYAKYKRSVGISYILAAAAGDSGPLGQTVLRNADVQKALSLLREQAKLFPEDPALYDWALLRNADSLEAGKMADVIRKDPRYFVEQSISVRLHPANAAEALEASWLMQICGKPAEAHAALKKVADLGIPVPEQP